MINKKFVSVISVLSTVICAILGTVNASAFERQEINLSAANSTQSYVTLDNNYYLYREVEPNDSIATTNIRISQDNQRIDERVLIGYVSQSDPADYYEIYVKAGTTYKIKLTPVGNNNLDLYLYNASGGLVAQSKSTQTEISEHITYSATTSRKLYIKVQNTSGTLNCQYRLFVNETVTESSLVQSLFPPMITEDYFEKMGKRCPDNASGIVVLTLGYAAKDYGSNTYGVIPYYGEFVLLSDLKTAVIKFVNGYNSNPNHTRNIQIAVSIVNRNAPDTAYSLELTTAGDGLTVSNRLRNHGISYANMIKELNTEVAALTGTNRVTGVYAGYDSEVDWNTYDNTYAWISGYGSVSGRRNIYVNADCPIAANGAETLTSKGWNYIRLRNVCCNPSFSAYPLPQVATRQAARNWLDFFNWLEKKQSESGGSSASYTYNTLVGLMNNNQYNLTGNFFCLNQIVDYMRNSAYTNQSYDYADLRGKYGASLPSSWFTQSTWCMSGTDYQLPAVFSSNTGG